MTKECGRALKVEAWASQLILSNMLREQLAFAYKFMELGGVHIGVANLI